MKKLFFVLVFTVMLLSCTEETITDDLSPKEEIEGIRITLSLKEEAFSPFQASFDSYTSCLPYEKEINSLTVCVYNPGNDTFFKRAFTSSEITFRWFYFPLPAAAAGDECEFYVIANSTVTATNREELLAMKEPDIAVYNGSFEAVTSGSCREGGFVMLGSTTQIISPENTVTPVIITLRRTVAKIVVDVRFSEEFKAECSGISFINGRVGMGNANLTSRIFPRDTKLHEGELYLNQQAKAEGEQFQTMFYAFEDDEKAEEYRQIYLLIRLSCSYTPKGSGQSVSCSGLYNVHVEGSGAGVIQRNACYHVQVIITGLIDSETKKLIAASPWNGSCAENFIINEDN